MAILVQNSVWERAPLLSASSSSNKTSHWQCLMAYTSLQCWMNSARLILWSLSASVFWNITLIFPIIYLNDPKRIKTYVKLVKSIHKVVRWSDSIALPEFLMRKCSITITIESIKESTPVSFGNKFFNCWHFYFFWLFFLCLIQRCWNGCIYSLLEALESGPSGQHY